MYQAREQPVTIQQVFKNQETKIVQIVIVFTRNHYWLNTQFYQCNASILCTKIVSCTIQGHRKDSHDAWKNAAAMIGDF